jgi:hypothetical protein
MDYYLPSYAQSYNLWIEERDWYHGSIISFAQWLHITAQIEGAGTSKYKLDRRLIMLPVPENLVKQPTHRMKGFATLATLWLELSDELKD